MTVLAWPSRLIPQYQTWRLANVARGGGAGIDGTEQVVMSGTGRWMATLTMQLQRSASILALRALIAGLDGRAGSLLIGPRDGDRVPWALDPLTGGPVTPGRAARSIARDPGYADNPDVNGTLAFALAADAPRNATTALIARERGGLLQPGQYFSIGAELHVITAVADTGDSQVPITFRPWLRSAFLAGTAVEFASPVATMRLATDDTAQLDIELARFGSTTIELVEAF